MGEVTLSTFRSQLFEFLENRSDFDPSESSITTKYNRWINYAYRHVTQNSVYEHTELEKDHTICLEEDVFQYTLPSDLSFIQAVTYLDTDQPITRMSFRELVKQRRINSNSGGRPSYYSRRARDIFFDVKPSAQYDGTEVIIYYYSKVTSLSDDDDTTEIDEWFDQCISHLAAAYAWTSLNNFAKADYFREFAVGLINEKQSDLDLGAKDPTDGFQVGRDYNRPYQERIR